MMAETGIRVEILWYDEDLYKVEVSVVGAEFAGAAQAYVGIGDLSGAADILEGFPSSPSDKREVLFGALGPMTAGGGIALAFYCSDGAGHAFVEARVEGDQRRGRGVENATVSLQVEAAAVDEFVIGMRELERNKHGSAFLRAS